MKKIFALVFVLLFSSSTVFSATLEPSRSDNYQGDYPLNTGVGLSAPRTWASSDVSGNQLTGRVLRGYDRDAMFFALYDNLHLHQNDPTYASRALVIDGATTYPFFRVAPEENGKKIYNFLNFPKPRVGADVIRNPFDPNVAIDKYTKGGYKDYNEHYYGTNSADPLGSEPVRLPLLEDANAPTEVFARLNQSRGGLLLGLYSSISMNEARTSPMTDLRVTGLDDNTKLNYRAWFSSPATLFGINETGMRTEHQKIQGANDLVAENNAKNNGEGGSVLAFNKDFDRFLNFAGDSISSQTEAAVELTGKRQIDYTNDIDDYGKSEHDIRISFRMLTVGGIARSRNWQHFSSPYQLSKKHFINIKATRPVISFDSGAYMAPQRIVKQNEAFSIDKNAIKIVDNPSHLTTQKQPISIDNKRIRVSLITEEKYKKFETDGRKNNNIDTVGDFSFLTVEDFNNKTSTIPAGKYFIKYDYSAPDSTSDISGGRGSLLGEVFAKPIFEPLEVLAQPNTPPVIIAKDATIEQGEQFDLLTLLVSATDAEDGDVTKNVIIKDDGGFNYTIAGEYEITFGVADSAGQEAIKKVKVRVVAKLSPKPPKPNLPTPGSSGPGGYTPDQTITLVPVEKTPSTPPVLEDSLFHFPRDHAGKCVSFVKNLDEPKLIRFYHSILQVPRSKDVSRDVTRAEFIRYIILASGINIKSDSNTIASFMPIDVPVDHNDMEYIAFALKHQIIHGQTDGKNLYFRPNDTISRAEASKIFIRVLGLTPNKRDSVFVDVNTQDSLTPYIQASYDNCLLHGRHTRDGNPIDGKRRFEPLSPITVAETAKVLYNMTQKQ